MVKRRPAFPHAAPRPAGVGAKETGPEMDDVPPSPPQPVRENADEKTNKKKRRRGEKVSHDLVLAILARLPVKTLLRFRCVSKCWLASMAEPKFISNHLEASRAARPGSVCVGEEGQNLFVMDTSGAVNLRFRPPPHLGKLCGDRPLLQSCNGLLLAFTSTRVLVCNPATRHVFALPEFTVEVPGNTSDSDFYEHLGIELPNHHHSMCSLGFDPLSRQYKVLHMANLERTDGCWDCEILTLGDAGPPPCWRKIGCSPRPVWSLHHAFLDGVIYWMTAPEPGNKTESTDCLMSFDLREDRFGLLSLPKPLTKLDYTTMTVTVLHGHLCIAETGSWCFRRKKVLRLWLFMGPSETNREWDLERIRPPFRLREGTYPVAIHRGEVLMNEFKVLKNELKWGTFYYILHDGSVKELPEAGGYPLSGPVADYVESLVWPLPLN